MEVNKRFGTLVVLYSDHKDSTKVIVRCDCGHKKCPEKFRVRYEYLTLQGLSSCNANQSRRFTKRYPKFKYPSSDYEIFYNRQVEQGLAVDISERKYNYLRNNCQSCGSKESCELRKPDSCGWYNNVVTSVCSSCASSPRRRMIIRRKS